MFPEAKFNGILYKKFLLLQKEIHRLKKDEKLYSVHQEAQNGNSYPIFYQSRLQVKIEQKMQRRLLPIG